MIEGGSRWGYDDVFERHTHRDKVDQLDSESYDIG